MAKKIKIKKTKETEIKTKPSPVGGTAIGGER